MCEVFKYHEEFKLDGSEGVKLLEIKQGFLFENLKLDVSIDAVVE